MKKITKMKIAGLLIVPALLLGVTLTTGTMDVAAQITAGTGATGQSNAAAGADVKTIIKNVVNALLFLIGALSVVMLIWGGIRYTTSAGNQNSVTAAKNTILYAIIGLVVIIFAFAITTFINQRF